MPITRATNLAGLGTIFDSLTDGGGLSVSGISTFTDLNITRVNITGVGTISNGSITNLTGTSSTITTLRSTTLNADTGNIVTGVTTNFTSTNGSITNLTGTSSTITTLRSTTGNFTTGNIVTGVTTNFNAANVVITGVTTVSAGTAALPSISPSGDSNTGIFFPAADHLNFSTGGTSRVQIDSDGDINIDGGTVFVDAVNNRFGIGTTSPGNALEVNGTIASKAGNNASKIQLGNDSKWSISTNVIDSIYNDRILLFQSDSSLGTIDWENNAGTGKLMRLHYSGNLLIGTTTRNANGGILQLSSGITFPATAVAASDANTLDDYEEGTWTPTQGAGLTVVGTFSSAGHYTKVGRQVTIQGYVAGSTTVAAAANGIICTGLPFAAINVTGSHFIGSASNGPLSALINVWVNQNTSTMYSVTAMTATAGIYFTVSYFTV